MAKHDSLCPQVTRKPPLTWCLCEHNAEVRADERQQLVEGPLTQERANIEAIARDRTLDDLQYKVVADRDDLTDKIKQGPDVHDWDQIDQWTSELVAVNRILTMLKEAGRG